LFVLAGLLHAGAGAAPGLSAEQAWRRQAEQVRQLADNDAPRSYREARLLQRLPADGTPEDRALALNLLARIEINLGMTDEAAAHARQAFDIAHKRGDRIGQAEADDNMAVNALNQADINLLVKATTHGVAVLEGVDRPALLSEMLQRAALMYRRLGQIDESVRLCTQALELARRSKDAVALIFAHQCMAVSFDQSDRVPEALEQYEHMLENALAARSTLQEAYAQLGVAGMRARMGDWARGEALLRGSIQLFRQVGTPFGTGHGLHQLANFLRSRGRYQEAQVALDEARSIYEGKQQIGLWFTLMARSVNLESLGQPSAAVAEAHAASAVAEAIGLPLYIGESTRRLADIAAKRGDYKQAYRLEHEASGRAARAAQERLSANVIGQAERYEAEAHQREIESLTGRNEQQAAELRRRELEQRWLWTILIGSMLALAGAGYLVRRLRSSQHALADQREILQSVLDSMGDGVLVASERGELRLVNPAGERIVGLRRDEGNAQAWVQRGTLYLMDQQTPCPADELPMARAIRGEACDGVEFFVCEPGGLDGRWLSATSRPLTDKTGATRGGVVVVSDVTARRHATQEIHSLNELRRELEFRREAAREEERKHIARELHDELGQFLSALRMELSLVRMRWGDRDAELRDKARSLQGMVDHIIGVVRNLVASLRPAVLDMGIASALEWLTAEFQTTSGVPCRLQIDEDAVRLDEQQTNVVFRVVQESLTNVTRHAGASQVRVALEVCGQKHVLTVRDDGVGFDPLRATRRSFGLLGMRERAQMLGGRLDVQSMSGIGTLVTMTFPVVPVPAPSPAVADLRPQ